MKTIEEKCLDCGSPVIERQIISHPPFLRINVIKYSCGAKVRKDEAGRLFHSGCSTPARMAA